jgi:hypothetical protein
MTRRVPNVPSARMNVADAFDAIEKRDIRACEKYFRALCDYYSKPAGVIVGPDATGQSMLVAIFCGVLIGDQSIMPRETCVALEVVETTSYAGGALHILKCLRAAGGWAA